MNGLEKLTEKNFQDLLIKFYEKGTQAENVDTRGFLNEMEKMILMTFSVDE
ncbi:hypothetical protein WAK64_11840 [Bacillus spongiae]|uniref:Fur-regulated basic protein FbpA n=1 Tax=Bacillus spongiae TaxID=2683610 RepID=A0ABU8HF36_9BACI